MTTATIALEAEFSPSTWTPITVDSRANIGIKLSRGKRGNNPLDRIASTGTLTFALDNSTKNIGGQLGYYSPDHATPCSGWDLGTRGRLKITYGGVTYYKFLGKVAEVEPIPGQYRERAVNVIAVDYMDELASHKLKRITAQSSVRGEELLASVITNMPTAPTATAYGTGVDTYTRGLHNERDEATTGMNACQKIAQSGMDDIYITGDLTAGETFVYRSRHERIRTTTITASFSDTMVGMTVRRARDTIYNQIKTITHPVQKDTIAVILYSIQREISLGPGQVYTFTARYSDPLSSGRRVSGEDMVAPAADTDYKMSSVPEDSGNDLNNSLGISRNVGTNSTEVILTNNAGRSGFVNRFNLRGYGLYEYDPVEITGQDDASRTLHGDRPLNYDMPYQDNPNVGTDFKNYLLPYWKSPHTNIESIEFIANTNATLMTAALACEVGKRITISETVTGLSSQDYLIDGYGLSIESGGLIRCTLGPLEKVDTTAYWRLGTAGYSELGVTTKLGY